MGKLSKNAMSWSRTGPLLTKKYWHTCWLHGKRSIDTLKDPKSHELKLMKDVKSLVTELTPLHAQSIWRFRGKMVQTVELVARCNYL